jgi:hypothetical protein
MLLCRKEKRKGAYPILRLQRYTHSIESNNDLFPAHKIVLDSEDRKEMVKHLLVAADRCAVERLKLICEGILCRLRLRTWIPR